MQASPRSRSSPNWWHDQRSPALCWEDGVAQLSPHPGRALGLSLQHQSLLPPLITVWGWTLTMSALSSPPEAANCPPKGKSPWSEVGSWREERSEVLWDWDVRIGTGSRQQPSPTTWGSGINSQESHGGMLLLGVPTAVDHPQNPAECIQQQQYRLACICQEACAGWYFIWDKYFYAYHFPSWSHLALLCGTYVSW